MLPDYLLREGSVIEQMVTLIPEDDWKDQVQIIGWLYQYYNTEPKDKVFADLKKNIKISKEHIPAATQLFTPDWIVHYMVENSLGRLWLEGHPNNELKSKWKYYLDEAEQEPDVQAQLAEIRKQYAALKPEEILTIDPCAGSGHILCVLFDVLVRIYEDYGYTAREAAASIVQNNLWGLDIDDRAAQLAYFAVMMKARQYDRRFFTREVQPHVYAIQESNGIHRDHLHYLGRGMSDIERNNARNQMNALLDEFIDAKEYGSILQPGEYDWALLSRFVADTTPEQQVTFDESGVETTQAQLRLMIAQGQALAQKYHAVVTNPPYMGASNMNPMLSEFIKANYTDYKSDFFSVFVVRCSAMARNDGYCGFFTPYVWMFIQSYEKLRQYLYTNCTIETLIQFEYSAFEEATVPVCTFTFQNRHIQKKGCYLRLVDFRGGMEVQRQKTLEAIENHDCGFYYEQSTDNFSKIPGAPVAYWVSESILTAYEQGNLIGDSADVKIGMGTGKNEIFVRDWWEVFYTKIDFSLKTINDLAESKGRYFPYNKGGEFRLWFGNLQEVLWFDAEGRRYMDTMSGHRENGARNFYCKEGLTWSFISSSKFGIRYLPAGCFFDVAGSTLFSRVDNAYTLGFLASCVCFDILGILNPTLNYQAGNIKSLPLLIDREVEVDEYVYQNIQISKDDWDSFETSWDFKEHPLIRWSRCLGDATSISATIQYYYGRRMPVSCPLELCYLLWQGECNKRFEELKANEEALNRIFIDIYGLQDELTPDVDDKDVTVRKADLSRDIRSLISYAVGCMVGRYSLDKPGLAFAGGAWDASQYVAYPADKDGILPITDDEYFADDIVTMFVNWLKTVYGADTLEENLRFISDALGGKGSPREVIRNYFLNDFYKDHLKVYQKRPIYWLFDSGKKNGFKALVYMHRYQPDTIARVRTDYVHEMQSRYRTAIADVEQRLNDASTSERVKLTKRLNALQAQADELRQYEEKIHHLADQMIAIDLDDGVKVNYAKFADVLATIK